MRQDHHGSHVNWKMSYGTFEGACVIVKITQACNGVLCVCMLVLILQLAMCMLCVTFCGFVSVVECVCVFRNSGEEMLWVLISNGFSSLKIKGKSVSPRRLPGSAAGYPERLTDLLPQKFSRPDWTKPWQLALSLKLTLLWATVWLEACWSLFRPESSYHLGLMILQLFFWEESL